MDELQQLMEAVERAESVYNTLSGDKHADLLLCDAAAHDVLAATLRLRSYFNRQRRGQNGKDQSAA